MYTFQLTDGDKLFPKYNFVNFQFSDACHPYEPFKCPGDGNCISIQYLCDGAPDCSDGYDEDMRLCTAGECSYNKSISVFFSHNHIIDGKENCTSKI